MGHDWRTASAESAARVHPVAAMQQVRSARERRDIATSPMQALAPKSTDEHKNQEPLTDKDEQ